MGNVVGGNNNHLGLGGSGDDERMTKSGDVAQRSGLASRKSKGGVGMALAIDNVGQLVAPTLSFRLPTGLHP